MIHVLHWLAKYDADATEDDVSYSWIFFDCIKDARNIKDASFNETKEDIENLTWNNYK